MAWDTAPSLTQRFAAVRDYLTAMFPSRRRVGRTYRGFSEAMAAVSPWLEEAVQRQLREAVAGLAGRRSHSHKAISLSSEAPCRKIFALGQTALGAP